MANRVLRWYIEGAISKEKTEVGGTHILDADYEAAELYMMARVAGSKNEGTEIDITADDVSIFDQRPVLNSQSRFKKWTTIPKTKLREGQVMRCDITSLCDQQGPRDLTVELFME